MHAHPRKQPGAAPSPVPSTFGGCQRWLRAVKVVAKWNSCELSVNSFNLKRKNPSSIVLWDYAHNILYHWPTKVKYWQCIGSNIRFPFIKLGVKASHPRCFATMVKRLPIHVRNGNKRMPFQPGAESKKPSTQKQKQRAWVNAGLRTMKAPMVRCFKTLVGWWPRSVWMRFSNMLFKKIFSVTVDGYTPQYKVS